MKKSIVSIYTIFRNISMFFTFIMAVILERAGESRFVFMTAIFTTLLIWIHIRAYVRHKFSRLFPYTFLVDIILLVILDDSSKYVVNYYFNVYYFYILLEAGFMLERKWRLFISFGVIAAAFIKYYQYVEVALFSNQSIYNTPFVISYIFFSLMVFVSVAFFFNYSRILAEDKKKLDNLNRELKKANELLEEKNEIIKELTIFEERNRIAREIHDSVGHNLTGLFINLSFCEKIFDSDVSKVKPQIIRSRDIAKECLKEIRKSVQALKPQSVEQMPLIKSIKELIENSKQKFNMNINLTVEGEMLKTSPECNIVVYRAVQEAVTNAVKHGMAANMNIIISFGKTEVSVFIKDDGNGAKVFKMGNGLKGMAERVKELKGDIGFYKNNGFMIHIKIPYGDLFET